MAKKKAEEVAAVWVDIETLKPWDNNPRKNAPAVQKVADSIERFGFGSPIVARLEDSRIIAGHTRLKAAQSLGHRSVPVRFLDISNEEASLLALADNRLGEIAEWDDSGLAEVLKQLEQEGASFEGVGFDDSEIEEIIRMIDGDSGGPEDNPYTAKITPPIYEVTGEMPDETELYDQDRTGTLIDRIKKAKLDKKVKEFLLAAAARHTAFQYDKIAEYYAHASPEVQELMEDSALIIIDFDKAIELGFVQMSQAISEAAGVDHAG